VLLPLSALKLTYRPMLRLLSRFLGYWLLAAALVAAVVDGAKSIAASAMVTTSVAETWATIQALLAPGEAVEAASSSTPPWPLDFMLNWLLTAPTAVIAATLGLVLLVLGRKRRAASFGREFAT
jgi:hypothetical protein